MLSDAKTIKAPGSMSSCSAARSSRDEITIPRVPIKALYLLHLPAHNTAEMLLRVSIVNFRKIPVTLWTILP